MSLIVLTGTYFLSNDQMSFESSVFCFPFIAIGYGFMVIGAISPTSVLYKWNSRITTFMASLSYAIYLTHKGVIHITHQLLNGFMLDKNLMLLISIITCICFALLLNITIEKPFMKLRKKIVGN